jgi:tRNA A37 N6-isopentenylltransferase MiaA
MKQNASDLALEYIRNYYRVEAYKGKYVKYQGQLGVIVGGTGAYLLVLLDGEQNSRKCHPTWEIEYIDEVA